MLLGGFAVVLIGVVAAKLWSLARRHAADMGSVSHSWVIAHNASDRASE